jgi:hypothetical protein
MEAFTDTVYLRVPSLRLRMLDLVYAQVQLIVVLLQLSAVLGPTVGQDA